MVHVLEVDDPIRVVQSLVAMSGTGLDRDLIRGRLSDMGVLFRLPPPPRVSGVYAVDSAFPSSPRYLVGYSLSLVAVAAVSWESARRIVKRWLLAESFNDLSQDYVAGFARLQERRLALSIESRVIVLDGEVLPGSGRHQVWKRVKELSLELVDSKMSGCGAVVGVLKRSYSRSLSSRLGVNVSDRVLSTLVLRRGEAVMYEHPLDELAERGCVESFYMPLRGPSIAIKAELCCSNCLDCLSLVSLLAHEASRTGLPWAIDLVDSIVKREVTLLSSIEAGLLTLLARRESGVEMAVKANPQERRGSTASS